MGKKLKLKILKLIASLTFAGICSVVIFYFLQSILGYDNSLAIAIGLGAGVGITAYRVADNKVIKE